MKLLFTRFSTNRKTGPIPVSTSEQKTCPDACPLKKNGCYGDGGPIAIHWRRLSEGKTGNTWEAFLRFIRSLPAGQTWRHNQVGDLWGADNRIDAGKLKELVTANRNRNGFTYTHYPVLSFQANAETIESNRNAIAEANRNGFTINLSANNLHHADKLFALGIAPVATVLPSSATKNCTTPGGNRVVVCPATQKENVTCSTCKLCQRANRAYIIGFPAHGISHKRIDNAIAAA